MPGNNEPIYLYLEENFRSNYYTQVLKKHWELWEKNVKPVITKEDDKKGQDFAAKAGRRKSIKMVYEEATEEEKDDNAMSFAQQAFGAQPY